MAEQERDERGRFASQLGPTAHGTKAGIEQTQKSLSRATPDEFTKFDHEKLADAKEHLRDAAKNVGTPEHRESLVSAYKALSKSIPAEGKRTTNATGVDALPRVLGVRDQVQKHIEAHDAAHGSGGLPGWAKKKAGG